MLYARDIMTTPVETVSPDDEVREVLRRLARAGFNGFPVVDGDRLVGIVTQSDLVGLFQTRERVLWIPIGLPPFSETLTYAVDVSWDDLDLGVDLARNVRKSVREVMTTEVVTVTPDADLDRLLDVLGGRINRVPVVEDERVVGIVTREDLVRGIQADREERAVDE